MRSQKSILKLWQEFTENTKRATPVNDTETAAEKVLRIKELEKPGNQEQWFKYYFPSFAFAEPTEFHIAASNRVIENPEWYEVRAWSRELAKSTRTMFDVFYLTLVKGKRNVILTSNSEDNAERLLLPYKVNFESNDIIHDYGEQQSIGNWEGVEFITKTGIAFRGIGAGQSPRGSRNQEIRPDILLVDDIDTDADCKNPKTIKKRWEWVEEALMGTRSISRKTTIIFCGNVIAKDCCIVRAGKMADYVDIVNIRDENGKSTWPSKNTEEMIDRVLSKITYRAAQKEYYNNPITEGTVFKKLSYKEMQPLKEYSMLVCYTDPSYKETSSNDFKATALVGKWKDEFHVIKVFVQQTTISNMVAWHYDIMNIVGMNACYYYMEEVLLQDMFYAEFWKAAKETGKTIPIAGDTRAKPDKFQRIESGLEPLNRNGKLYFNIAEKDDPNMMVMDEQFLDFEPGSNAHDDAPDAVEGAYWIINNKQAIRAAGGHIKLIKHKPNTKRM